MTREAGDEAAPADPPTPTARRCGAEPGYSPAVSHRYRASALPPSTGRGSVGRAAGAASFRAFHAAYHPHVEAVRAGQAGRGVWRRGGAGGLRRAFMDQLSASGFDG